MKTTLLTIVVLISALLVGWLSIALAGEGNCAHCGCACACQKVCRLVCEEKKVEIVCWGCKHEDFCLPGPGERGCKHCETVCDDPTVCNKPKDFVWYDWIAGCASLHTKTKLMKKTITKKVPSYKYVVEDLCEGCKAKVEAEPAKPQ